MQVFVVINKDGIKINRDVNVKNWLIKILVIKNLFRILVTVIGNVINQFDGGEYFDLENCKCKKKKKSK